MTIYALALTGFLGAVLALYLQHLYEKYIARRNERQLEDERRMRNGFKTGARMGWIENYKTRLSRFNEDCH